MNSVTQQAFGLYRTHPQSPELKDDLVDVQFSHTMIYAGVQLTLGSAEERDPIKLMQKFNMRIAPVSITEVA